ncbi:glucosamine-6-phosphate deaminase [Cyclobacterium qasimii]|uniref:Glucosamine-6-phosphate deaminase n=2 Tax=Cyclobacterium qasimii TaxID=1350429 RepID=S7VAQ2_9BACT|nr:glucosamine-6-phosphate deaminase [Cyclobacterium qasimii]EPR67305.1 Glucosamine-6-phosphate deaminase [Cyclobacterium qasimii M12-11B]GEO22219.1 glucosamine-6-phosphate deaminase [Cyclobacterium qasimii]
MRIFQSTNPKGLGKLAGEAAAPLIREAIKSKGKANLILATGTSQFETISQLLDEAIDWSKVTVFHLDEYIGIPITHPASFRKYLKERFVDKVEKLGAIHYINGENDPEKECERLKALISGQDIDVAFVGIGENGHLAFNDPPADFDTKEPYLVVDLDVPCREQQMNEGWFATLEDVPRQAISMSIQQIMKSEHIICSVPDDRKANAVKNCLEGEVSNMNPSSILQEHASCSIYLDDASASLLTKALEK